MQCKWFSEMDSDLHAAAAEEAGAEAQVFGDLLLLHPRDLPEVDLQSDFFLLIGGPECQPFSKAGKGKNLYDRRARTLLWIVWCLAERQFHGAFVENVGNLLYIDNGRVYGTLLAVLEGIGYTAVTAVDCPLRHGIPHARERAFISILRSDLSDRWGLPAAVPTDKVESTRFLDKGAHSHGETFVPIEELLLPPDHPAVVAEIAEFAQVLIDAGPDNNPRFVERNEEQERRYPRKPRVAWKCGTGSFGCQGFTHAVPAVKVFGEGP
jgi:site-specific DNA-cytosine methylase